MKILIKRIWRSNKNSKRNIRKEFPQRNMSLFMLNIKMLKKTKRYLKQNNELYKFKCILKQKHIQLPEFSREIKLSFHLDQFTTPQIQQQPSANTTSNSTLQDAAIFQLPTIKINNSRYSVFFDSGCSNFVSRYNAIRSLTSNATQECPGPITIGGVRVVISVSQHGIYKVNLSPMMEVKLQCQEFVLIISHRNVQYTHYKAKCWMASPKLSKSQEEMQELFQKYQTQ